MAQYDLDKALTRLNDDLAQVDALRERILEDIAIVHQAIDIAVGPREAIPTPTHGSTKPEDIANSSTHLEAAITMAKTNDDLLHVTAASKVIQAAGLSEAKASSIAATLHNRLSASGDWEYVEPGVFKYLGPTKDSEWSPMVAAMDVDDLPF